MPVLWGCSCGVFRDNIKYGTITLKMALFAPSPPSSVILPKVRSDENIVTAQTLFFPPLNAQYCPAPVRAPLLPQTNVHKTDISSAEVTNFAQLTV